MASRSAACTPRASSSVASSGSTTPAAPASPTVRCSAGLPGAMQGNSLLRGLDPVLAHGHARRDELAIAFHPRAAEDRLARLEIGARARHEGHDLRVLGDEDLLLAVLVLERELVATARLRIRRYVG